MKSPQQTSYSMAKTESFPKRSETKAVMHTLATPIQHNAEVLARAIRQIKDI